MDTFKAVVIRREGEDGPQSVAMEDFQTDQLMDGNVDIRVSYSTINYKDGLAITGKLPVVRRFPMIPGIDLAGTVLSSSDTRYAPGDEVVLNGWGVGEVHLGAWAQMARLNADWLVPLPDGMSGAEAMAIGTAGYTAMLSVMALESQEITPKSGPVVVTGATGGVGSVAIALLAGLGYEVHAVTGRESEGDYLRGLGAHEIVAREELAGKPRMLGKERWAAAVDAVGSTILANVIAQIRRGGVVAACGNAAGMDLPTSVAPFILRGVSLRGIDSVMASYSTRVEAWRRLATELDRTKLSSMTNTVGLAEAEKSARDLIDGRLHGRIVVKID